MNNRDVYDECNDIMERDWDDDMFPEQGWSGGDRDSAAYGLDTTDYGDDTTNYETEGNGLPFGEHENGYVLNDKNADLNDSWGMYQYLQSHNLLVSSPGQEDLIRIRADYISGNKEKEESATMEMIGILYAFLINIINRKYRSFASGHMNDLIENGYVGIMKGMKNYNPVLGKPTTWFRPFIDHEIQAYINSQICHSTDYYNHMKKLIFPCIREKEKRKEPYTIDDISQETGVSVKTIRTCLQIHTTAFVSFNDLTDMQCLASDDGNPAPLAIQQAEKDLLHMLIYGDPTRNIPSLLTAEEKECIELRYGFGGFSSQSYPQIQEATGMTKYQINKLLASGMDKLRRAITSL